MSRRLLVKWYDVTRWMLERVESYPKNQRFVFGQRLADRTLNILEVLVEAAYSPRKADLLTRANRDIEVLRWLVRMATDRKLLTPRQYEHYRKHSKSAGTEGGTAEDVIWRITDTEHHAPKRRITMR